MAQPKSEFDKQMQYLEAEIRRLEAEFNMFLAGRLPRPPWETRAKVAALVKRTDQSYIRNTADRFRFETIQNRYQKYIELWDRQMTNRELGRGPGQKKPAAAPAPSPTPTPAQAAGDAPAESRRSAGESSGAKADAPAAAAAAAAKAREAAERTVKFGRADDTSVGSSRVKELYEQLAAAKKQVGEEPVAFDRVQALVRAQVQKHGGEGNVAFKIGMKDGKVSLTVKAEKENE